MKAGIANSRVRKRGAILVCRRRPSTNPRPPEQDDAPSEQEPRPRGPPELPAFEQRVHDGDESGRSGRRRGLVGTDLPGAANECHGRHHGPGAGRFLLWMVMMAAMMLPAVAPVATLYARTASGHSTAVLVAVAIGYLAVWALVGVLAFPVATLATSFAMDSPAKRLPHMPVRVCSAQGPE